MCVTADGIKEVFQVLVQEGVPGDVGLEFLQLSCARQISIDQEVGDLKELRLCGQFFDWVSAIAKNPLLAMVQNVATSFAVLTLSKNLEAKTLAYI